MYNATFAPLAPVMHTSNNATQRIHEPKFQFSCSICHHCCQLSCFILPDDVIKWKHFPSYWPFVWGIHRWPVNSPHKGQWRGALVFSLISSWTNGWVNNRDAGDVRHHRAHYDVTVSIINARSFFPVHYLIMAPCLCHVYITSQKFSTHPNVYRKCKVRFVVYSSVFTDNNSYLCVTMMPGTAPVID